MEKEQLQAIEKTQPVWFTCVENKKTLVLYAIQLLRSPKDPKMIDCDKGPSSLEEAIEIIKANCPMSYLQDWAKKPELEARTAAHFGLGLCIRNKWLHPNNRSPLYENIKDVSFGMHTDDMSGIILSALWRVLNGLPCPSIEELLPEYKKRSYFIEHYPRLKKLFESGR